MMNPQVIINSFRNLKVLIYKKGIIYPNENTLETSKVKSDSTNYPCAEVPPCGDM